MAQLLREHWPIKVETSVKDPKKKEKNDERAERERCGVRIFGARRNRRH